MINVGTCLRHVASGNQIVNQTYRRHVPTLNLIIKRGLKAFFQPGSGKETPKEDDATET